MYDIIKFEHSPHKKTFCIFLPNWWDRIGNHTLIQHTLTIGLGLTGKTIEKKRACLANACMGVRPGVFKAIAPSMGPFFSNPFLGFFLPKLGVPSWGPHNKDYGMLGSMLGSPYLGKLPYG